jgi:hypothetical protein
MILIENIDVLRQRDRTLLDKMKRIEEAENDRLIKKVETKSGHVTIQVEKNGKPLYIHSKYDPLQEAERIVDQYKDVDSYQHVFFYGVGMGYHIDLFLKKYPHLPFTLYEPDPTVLYYLLTEKKLSDLPLTLLKNIVVESSPDKGKAFLTDFSNHLHENVLLVHLPSYERIFNDEYTGFLQSFKQAVTRKRFSFNTNINYEKRWTMNCMKNFLEIAQTPNILSDFDSRLFEGKPAILVAAGPSLQEEIENLRSIKEQGSAYIFSVGSAINSLVHHGIFPDAACTYDPSVRNQIVFERIKEEYIDSIPLIFGSSVGFETIQGYPGPKAHMITSQDTVSPYYLKANGHPEIDYVNDSTSIAVVTIQLLNKLNCNPIILVGQDLATKNNQRYAEGISYKDQSGYLTDSEIKSTVQVVDVYGNQVITKENFNRHREQLEMYIQNYHNKEVINTSKGGAKINGTVFTPLEEVMATHLIQEQVVEKDWFNTSCSYEIERIKQQQRKIDGELEEFKHIVDRLYKILRDMDYFIKSKDNFKINKQLQKYDKELKRMRRNQFYQVFLKPMSRVQFELLNKRIRAAKFQSDLSIKAEAVSKASVQFLKACTQDLQQFLPDYQQLKSEIMEWSTD